LRRNPQHPEPVFFQEFRPFVVAPRPIGHVVRDPVYFDDQSLGETAEVDDVGTNRMLAPELQTLRPHSQLLPQ
jgi:hypothetical protein